jgi:hypothetical protein
MSINAADEIARRVLNLKPGAKDTPTLVSMRECYAKIIAKHRRKEALGK